MTTGFRAHPSNRTDNQKLLQTPAQSTKPTFGLHYNYAEPALVTVFLRGRERIIRRDHFLEQDLYAQTLGHGGL